MGAANWCNYCCRSGGNNLNAGTVDGSTTEPATTPLVTYTGGDYNATTNVYTAPVGADMTEAQVGRWASVYVDGDTSPTTNQWFTCRITAVNAGARTVTFGTTLARLGTETSTGTGNRSMRIGGAWAGPSGTNRFPFSLTNLASATNAAGDGVRINLKNDQTYSMTAALTQTSPPAGICGYSSTYQDGGKAIIDGGTSGASYVLFTAEANRIIQDLHFRNNGATGTTELTTWSAGKCSPAFRCVFEGGRGAGIRSNNGDYNNIFISCEVFDCNQSNTATSGGISGTGTAAFLNTISHDNAYGPGADLNLGFHSFVRCIFDSNPDSGVEMAIGKSNLFLNCDSYNNGLDGFWLDGDETGWIVNCNIAKNGRYGVNFSTSLEDQAWLIHSAFGAGTFVNTTDFWNDGVAGQYGLTDYNSVYYPADTSPWVAPASGDFTIATDFSRATGYGAFTQTATSYSGTVAYNDIGAASSDTDVSRVQVSVSSLTLSPPGHAARYVDY